MKQDVDHNVEIRLSSDEALVLFSWLTTQDFGRDAETISAEQMVLWKVEAQIEKVLLVPLEPEYESSVEQARRRVVDHAIEI